MNVKSEFDLSLNGSNYENPCSYGYQNYGSPADFAEPEAKRRALAYSSSDTALSPPLPASPWQAATTNSSATTSADTDDQRFTAKRKQEIQYLIDHGQVNFVSSNEKGFHKVVHNNVALGLQCSSCFALFSTRTRTYLKSHVEKCAAIAKNQAPYPLAVHEKRMINFYLAELMAMDSKFSLIAETEAFQDFVYYIKNLGFNVGRKFTNFSTPMDILSSPLEVKNSLAAEVHQLVQNFKDFLNKHTVFEYVVALDHQSLKGNYMGTIIRFVHDWQIKYFILNVQDVLQIDTNKSNHVKKVLHQFNLQFDHQYIISDKDMGSLEDPKDIRFLFCITQALKTIITQSTSPSMDTKNDKIVDDKILTVFRSKIEKLGNMVDLICNNPNLSAAETLQIFFEQRYKWISDVEMVEAWLKISEADKDHLLIHFSDDNGIICLIKNLIESHDDFFAFVTVVKPFQDKLQFLQSDYFPTINHVLITLYELENHLNQFKDSANDLVKTLWMSTSNALAYMKAHFTKPIHYVSCTVDIFQRAKIRQLREISEVKKAKDETEKLFVEYIKRNTPSSDKDDGIHPEIDDFAMCLDDELESNQNSIIIAAKNELAQYYRYTPSAESVAQKDVLLFWKSVNTQFPQLSKFASYILSVPACSNFIDKICPISTKMAANEKSLDASIVSDLVLCKSLQNLNLS